MQRLIERCLLPGAVLFVVTLTGCISKSESGRVYLSFTPLIIIGVVIWIISMLRR